MSNYIIGNDLEADGESKLEELINNTVSLDGEQTITGTKTFESIIVNNEIIHNHTSFSTEDGIIHQLKNNTSGDALDYGNYATYEDGGERYKGIINKAGSDQFIIFHDQTNEPISSLNLATQNLGTVIVRNPIIGSEVSTKNYADTKLSLSGGTMTGDINIAQGDFIYFGSTGTIRIGADSSNDFLISRGAGTNIFMRMSGTQLEMRNLELDMGGSSKIVRVADGVSSTDAINKGQLDAEIARLEALIT